ncbi:MAG: hypothetical protein CMA34_07110 [Euryarchaeota archaeon]|nr:hypothetical protein [Euryarchaeota archaeon]
MVKRTLVLTIDRDNDLGTKAAIRGPVIGRKSVLTAALKLGIADPEESDTNAILGALNKHDMLIDNSEESEQVEVAILTGDEKVGLRSDRIITSQLEEVIKEFQPDRAILVTDGAEDESVLPIIQSQVMVEHIQKIIVKQSKGIEGTYYIIAKALEDPKWRAKMLVPLSIFLIILGLGIMIPGGGVLIGAMPFLLGGYILAKGLGVDDTVARVMSDMRENVDAAMFSSIFWLGGVFTGILAIVSGWNEYVDSNQGTLTIPLALDVFHSSLTWIMITFLLMIGGLLLLRLKRGSFSGRMIVISAFAMVVYSWTDAALTILTEAFADVDYAFEAASILPEFYIPFIWIVILWMTSTIVRSLKDRTTQGNTYWGI